MKTRKLDKRSWTAKQDEFLIENYYVLSLDELSKELNRGKRGIQARATILGFCKRKTIKWTEEEDKRLKKIYPANGIKVTAELMNRSVHSVSKRCELLHIKKLHKWQKLNIDTILYEYKTNHKTLLTIADELKCTIWDVRLALENSNITIEKNTYYGPMSPNWFGYKDLSQTFWGSIQKSAKDRNILFDLTREFVWELYEKQDRKCSLSGMDICIYPRSRNKEFFKFNTASLDRIDSLKGYTEDNVQWVHKTVNHIKWALPQDEFISICKMIARNNSCL